MLAYIDIRPWILIFTIPLLFVVAWLWRRLFRTKAGYFTILFLLIFAFLAAFQFVLYGPFVDQERFESTPATWTFRNDVGSPPQVVFKFSKLPFGDIRTSDMDVFAYVNSLKTDTVTVHVQLTYDFGKMRGMNLSYAYVDDILFRPE